MKCPLMLKSWQGAPKKKMFQPLDCLQSGCGWYDQANNCCSVVALNQNLVAIGNVLGKLADRQSINVQLSR